VVSDRHRLGRLLEAVGVTARRVVTPEDRLAGRLVDIPSRAQFGFYRRVIVPGYADYAGFESLEEAHNHLKAGFFWLHPDDPRIPSMASMSFEECDRFLHWVIRKLAEKGRVVEEPRPRQGARP
jgi:hypothetical protein